MGILYIISSMILLINFILRKKSEKKIDIIGVICISIVLLFCYNTAICYILTFFTIPIKLWLLTIINLIFSLLLVIPIIRKREIQKYTFNKIDILYISIITIVLLVMAYINFGFPFDVKYETGDPSVHFLTSVMFAEQDALMPNVEPDAVYGDLSTRKPTSYVNSGLLMKCFCKDFDIIDCYNIFVSFGIFTLILIGITMYSALKKYANKKEHTFWAFLVALICTLGYPLNSFLFGFEYLTMGLLMICAIIDLVYYYENDILKFSDVLLIFGLVDFGLFCSYWMFVPFVFPALWIYFCVKNYNKTKKIVTRKLVVLLIITLLIPFILGYIYHLAPNIYAILINRFSGIDTSMEYSAYLVNSGLSVNGYIYINLYSNMLLLLPLTIYFFIKRVKDKDLKNEIFLGLLLLFAIVFIEILLAGKSFGKVSIYYLTKNYFALWIILAFTNYKALIVISEKNKYLSRLFIGTYVFLMVICTIFSNIKIEDISLNCDENILSVMEVFGANKTILLNKKPQFNQEELKILIYAKENLNYDSKIEVAANDSAYYWAYVLLDYINKGEEFENRYGGQTELMKSWKSLPHKINKVDYIIYFNKDYTYDELKDKLFENAEIIYENSAGGILKYKN